MTEASKYMQEEFDDQFWHFYKGMWPRSLLTENYMKEMSNIHNYWSGELILNKIDSRN